MRRALGLVLLGGIAALTLCVVFLEEIVVFALDPGGPFDEALAPTPPDFASPQAWTALPGRDDLADVAPASLPALDPLEAPADVFYVHPTSYIGSGWNGPVDDPTLNANTDRLATLIQATAFNGCCAVYGPRYRQANGQAFTRPSEEGDHAVDLAYADVAAGFRAYLERSGGGRPFFLVSHSQGTALAARLLREEVAGTPHQGRLVAAYLIGGPITAADVDVPVCGDATQTGCVVAWNARGPSHEATFFDFRVEGERLCVNPLSWRHDEEPAPARLNAGAVFLHAGDGSVQEHFADARCRDGTLIVSEIGEVPRDFMSRLLDYAMGPQNYHPIEYQLFWVNLRQNAAARLEAYGRNRSPGGL